MAGYENMPYSTGPQVIMIFRRKGKSLATFGLPYFVETKDILQQIPLPAPNDPVLELSLDPYYPEEEQYVCN